MADLKVRHYWIKLRLYATKQKESFTDWSRFKLILCVQIYILILNIYTYIDFFFLKAFNSAL